MSTVSSIFVIFYKMLPVKMCYFYNLIQLLQKNQILSVHTHKNWLPDIP